MSQIEKRKTEHIEICAKKNVSFEEKTTLLECVELDYNALPEIDLQKVSLNSFFLGKELNAPIIVSAITGGSVPSKKINKEIAQACENLGIGFGLGSMRAMLENPSLKETYDVRDVAPNTFIAGNIGAAQLRYYTPIQLQKALDGIDADALAVHLNVAQEAVQSEGDTNFSGIISKIEEFASKLSTPVYVKEVGHGISYSVAERLKKTRIKAIDVQGAGGTSWTKVDRLRSADGFSPCFDEIGIPTVASIIQVRRSLGENSSIDIIGSGGVRTGLDAVKCLVLGANFVGLALPVLKAQQKGGTKGVQKFFENFEREMRVSMFLTGCKNLKQLRAQRHYSKRKLKDFLEMYPKQSTEKKSEKKK